MRSQAILLTKTETDPMPWGKALLYVLKEHSNLRQEQSTLLTAVGRTGKGRGVTLSDEPAVDRQGDGAGSKGAGKKTKPPAQGGAATGATAVSRTKWVTAPARDRYCQAFQRKKGCARASCQFWHACNVVLENGKVCGAKNHGLAGHDPAVHGQPKGRA